MDPREQLRIKVADFSQQLIDLRATHINELMNERRFDEANLEKVQLNVILIFHSMFELTDQKTAGDDRELYKEYKHLLRKISRPWEDNRQQAIDNGNKVSAIIEEIKLSQANQIIESFDTIYQDTMIDLSSNTIQ